MLTSLCHCNLELYNIHYCCLGHHWSFKIHILQQITASHLIEDNNIISTSMPLFFILYYPGNNIIQYMSQPLKTLSFWVPSIGNTNSLQSEQNLDDLNCKEYQIYIAPLRLKRTFMTIKQIQRSNIRKDNQIVVSSSLT